MGSCISCFKKKTYDVNEYLLYNDNTSVRSSDTTINKNITFKRSLSESDLLKNKSENRLSKP